MRYLKELQTPEKRREKYRFCRAMGKNPSWSAAMRDWHWKRILANLGIPEGAGDFEEEFKPEYRELIERGGLSWN